MGTYSVSFGIYYNKFSYIWSRYFPILFHFIDLVSLLWKFIFNYKKNWIDNFRLWNQIVSTCINLFFSFFTKKYNLKLIISNNLSSAIICFFNFLVIYTSSLNPSSTIFQIKLIATSIIFYNVSYLLLFKFYKLNLKSKK